MPVPPARRPRGARRLVPAALAAGSLVAAAVVALPALATTPAALTVPQEAGGSTSATFSGTIPTGANPTSSCDGIPAPQVSVNTVDIAVPAGSYDRVRTTATFTITWTAPGDARTSDEILTVTGPDGQLVGDSDEATTTETVTAQNPLAGRYTITACGFVNPQDQPYTGTVKLASAALAAAPAGAAPLPTVDAQGLSFGATVAADIQRSESEPNMEIDQAGNIYTCGPTGFSNADDYAQVSTDGGDQFHLLGTPPRGQQGTGGGGDCGLATSAYKNDQGKYTYSYTGLGPLTGFTTSSSKDNGHTLENGGPQGNTDSGSGVLTDRQWQVFTDPNTVLLSYNQQQPRNVVVQKSTDGGVTYGVNGVVAAPSPLFPGPMRILKAELNPYKTGKPLVYFPWNNSANGVNLSVSKDAGATWTMCTVGTAAGRPAAGFMTADNDTAGNVYLSFADQTTFGTYLSTITNDKLLGCDQPVANTPATPSPQPTKNPGFTAPVRVNRGAVATTVFPWLVAGGEPGRVAIAYYGTQTPVTKDLDPNTADFKASWDVYVSQSLDALSPAGPTFGQVKATTHPMHYDSICLNGLGCSVSNPAGDRSLGDFFALDYSPATGTLHIVYDQSAKKPDEGAGRLATPAVLTQNAGPSNGGSAFPLGSTPTRPALRATTQDPADDALSAYSMLVPPGGSNTTPPRNEKAGDVLSATVVPEVDKDGKAVPDGGFSVTMKLADLSTAALQTAMSDTQSSSLLWIFRFANGFTASAASARYDAVQGFTYGFNDYDSGACGGGNCQKYSGSTPIVGKTDAQAGTITLSVPRSLLRGLKGDTGPGSRPAEVPATVGTRFYDAGVYTAANTQPTQTDQSYLYPLDNTAGMDFLLPAAVAAPSPSASPSSSASTSASPSPGTSASPGSTPSPSGSGTPSPGSGAGGGNGATTPGSGLYHPLVPARILDTREEGSPVVGGADRSLKVTGVGGVPDSGVSAVVLNVVATRSSGSGDLSVYPVGSKPANRTAVLGYRRGQTVPVLVTVGVGDGGAVGLSVNTGRADLVADVAGWYGTGPDGGLRYTALRPGRVLDTRTDKQPVLGGTDRVVKLTGAAGVPADAKAVVLNTTVTGASKQADLQVFPTGQRPAKRTSNLNVIPGQTVANAVVATLGTDGSVSLSLSQGSTHVVLDVLGYYADAGPARLVPLAPQRILDTREQRAPVRAGSDRVLQVSGAGGVPPAGATAAILSVTVLGATAPMDLQVYPTGDAPAQRTSTLNLRPGQTVSNFDVATLGRDGSVTLSVSQGAGSVVVDVLGYLVTG